MKEKWNKRYSSEEYYFGKEPNDFFKEQIEKINPGKVLFLGEGEGRNSVYASKIGWNVDAIDISDIGKEKALKLAKENNVSINYILDDVFTYNFNENYYDAIVLIYFHIPKNIRNVFYPKIFNSLKNGGTIIQLVYDEDHLKNNSNGPSDINMLYTLQEVAEQFIELDFSLFEKKQLMKVKKGKQEEATEIRFVGVKI